MLKELQQNMELQIFLFLLLLQDQQIQLQIHLNQRKLVLKKQCNLKKINNMMKQLLHIFLLHQKIVEVKID